jgi:hypothetical protein
MSKIDELNRLSLAAELLALCDGNINLAKDMIDTADGAIDPEVQEMLAEEAEARSEEEEESATDQALRAALASLQERADNGDSEAVDTLMTVCRTVAAFLGLSVSNSIEDPTDETAVAAEIDTSQGFETGDEGEEGIYADGLFGRKLEHHISEHVFPDGEAPEPDAEPYRDDEDKPVISLAAGDEVADATPAVPSAAMSEEDAELFDEDEPPAPEEKFAYKPFGSGDFSPKGNLAQHLDLGRGGHPALMPNNGDKDD